MVGVLPGDDNRVIVRRPSPDGEIALALIRHWFLIQNWSHNTGPSRSVRGHRARAREIVQDNNRVPELEPGVGNVAKLTEGYDVGIDANTAHASSSRWKCMRPRSVLDLHRARLAMIK